MRALIAVSIMLALSSSGAAAHCETWSTTPAEINAAGRYYVDPDCWQSSCPGIFSLWIYEESNGIAGLQRGDEIVDDTCHGMIRSDTVIF